MANSEIDYVSFLGKDSMVGDGKIVVPSHVKVAGSVKMNIDSEGKLMITDSGNVQGNITANEIQIHGEVNGEIHTPGSVTIYKTAKVSGVIYTSTLKVEEGAICNFDIVVRDGNSSSEDTKKRASGRSNLSEASQNGTTNRSAGSRNGKASLFSGLKKAVNESANGAGSNVEYSQSGHRNGKSSSEATTTEKPSKTVGLYGDTSSYVKSKRVKADASEDPSGKVNTNEKASKNREVDVPAVSSAKVPDTVSDSATGKSDNKQNDKSGADRFW